MGKQKDGNNKGKENGKNNMGDKVVGNRCAYRTSKTQVRYAPVKSVCELQKLGSCERRVRFARKILI